MVGQLQDWRRLLEHLGGGQSLDCKRRVPQLTAVVALQRATVLVCKRAGGFKDGIEGSRRIQFSLVQLF